MVTPFFSTASRRILPALCILALLMAAPALALTLSPGGTASGTISNGDPVYINGIATGHPQAGLQIWIIGPNYVKVAPTQVNNDNTYSYELRPADTQNLAPGQYVVLVQHPMMNGRLDITYDAATGKVTNQMTGTGTSIFSLTGAGSLQNPNAALALMEAISSPDINDTFAQVAFTIRSPTAFIDPVGTHAVGDTITFQGSTNLAVNNDLSVTIYSDSSQPTKKSQSSEFSGASGIVKVVPGTNGLNHWAFTADTSTWKPDKYLVTVSGVTVTATGSTSFALLPALPATTVVAPASPTVTYLSPTGAPTTVSTPVPPTNQSPAPVMAVAGLPAVLIAICAIRKKER